MTDILTKLALTQVFALMNETLKSENPDIALPADLPDKMFKNLTESQAGPLVSVRDVLPCRIPLPFMPDRIDYKSGKGCCDEILKSDGLFVPCSRHCEEGSKCSKHLKEPSGCGNYQERYAAWSKKELYCVVIGEKEIKEKPYGTYMHAKSLDSIAIEEELRKWGIPLRLDFTQWRAPPKPLKKNRGRKAVLKVTPSDSDSDQYESDDELKGPKETPQADLKALGLESDTEAPEAEHKEAEHKEAPEAEHTEAHGPDSDVEAEHPEAENPEDTEAPKEKKRPAPKKEGKKKEKKEKVKGTPLDAELKKEDMEEKAPKKGKFRGKIENLTVAEWNGVEFLTKDGKYYDSGTLELYAWTKNGEILLL